MHKSFAVDVFPSQILWMSLRNRFKRGDGDGINAVRKIRVTASKLSPMIHDDESLAMEVGGCFIFV
jgi:hypothetical protein